MSREKKKLEKLERSGPKDKSKLEVRQTTCIGMSPGGIKLRTPPVCGDERGAIKGGGMREGGWAKGGGGLMEPTAVFSNNGKDFH